jgi:chorismate synthase
MSSTWKNRISVSIFGQSHGAAIGVTMDGIPAGEEICSDELNAFLKRRAPGRFPWATPRKESDEPEFLSGIVNGKTCGTPITAIIKNTNTRPADYSNLQTIPRPGHADYPA